MKRIKGIIFTSLLVTALSSTTVFAGTDINVTLNGNAVQFTDAVPYVDNTGRTMMPVAKMGELLGVQVGWDNATQTVTLKDGTKVVSLKIGSNILNIDGTPTTMDTKAVIKDGRTYVPLSAIAKAFGTEVAWDGATSTISLKANSSSMFDWITGEGEYSTEDYSVINQNARNLYALDGNDFYYVDYKTNDFNRLDVVTGDEEVLLEDCGFVQDIFITDNYIFLKDGDKFSRMNKDGTGVIYAPFSWEDIQVYEDKIYFTTYPSYTLNVTDFDFANIEQIQEGFWTNFIVYDDKVVSSYSWDTGELFISTLDINTKKYNRSKIGTAKSDMRDIDVDLVTGNFVLTTNGNEIFVVNAKGELLSSMSTNYIAKMRNSLVIDNKLYYRAEEGIIEYDIPSQKAKILLGGKYSYITYIEGHLIVKGTNSTEVKIIDLSTGDIIAE